jgi:hypothetical protein
MNPREVAAVATRSRRSRSSFREEVDRVSIPLAVRRLATLGTQDGRSHLAALPVANRPPAISISLLDVGQLPGILMREPARYGPGVTRRAGLTSRYVLVAGLAALAVGVVVLDLAAAQPVSSGWFAFAPWSDTTFTTEGVHRLSTASLVGTVIVIISMLVLAAWLDYRQVCAASPDKTFR